MAGHNNTRRLSTLFNLNDPDSDPDDSKGNAADPNKRNDKQVAFENCDYSAIMFPRTRNLTRNDNNLPIPQPPSGSFSSALHFDSGIRPNPLPHSNRRTSTPYFTQETRKDTTIETNIHGINQANVTY